MSEPIISVSGLRGIVGESLTPEIAVRYAAAFVATLPPGPIVLTYDGRESGPIFLEALADGLSKLGREVINVGVAATPTTGVLVRHMESAGGIQISASHNPAQWNGLKLFSREGRVIPRAVGEKVLDYYRSNKATTNKQNQTGNIESVKNSWCRHVELVLTIVNVECIRKRAFHVLVDSNHGAGSIVGRLLLEHLGCKSTLLGGEPDGKFSHPPEPTAENLNAVLAKVVDNEFDIGFCQDPDADRLAVIDEKGRYLGEEYTLAICVDHVLRQRPGPVVTNCSTSRMTEDLAKKYGVPFYRSAVGEANVVDAMLKHGAVLGGEGNGGVIDPRVVLVRDSFTAMALILDAMAARNLPVSALADELPRYEICKTKISLPNEKLNRGLAAIEKHFSGTLTLPSPRGRGESGTLTPALSQREREKPIVSKLDGLRLDWDDKWLLVRGSNTEPVVRAIAEAPTAAEAERLCRDATEALQSA